MSFLERIGIKKLVAISLVAVVAGTTFYAFYDLNDDSTDFSGREVRLIITGSMDGESQPYKIPTIPKDSLVMVRKYSESEKPEIQIGDVVQFRQGSILNHHRVVENNVTEGYLITHGDANAPEAKEKVYYEDVRGEVIGCNHALGVLVKTVKDYAMFFLIVLIAVFVTPLFLDEYRKEKNGGK